MSENWFSPTAGRGKQDSTYFIMEYIKEKNSKGKKPTCERVISFIVFVDPPLVLSEYLESLIVLLHAVQLVVLKD